MSSRIYTIDPVQTIQPIPTFYKGITYRSRVEARWQIFFNRLNLHAVWEKEGYPLPSGWYLPDYWITTLEHFAEVKGKEFSDVEIERCRELAIATGFPVLLLPDVPAVQWYERCVPDGEDVIWDLYRFSGDVEAAVNAARSERFDRRSE